MLISLLFFCLMAFGDNLTERQIRPVVVDAETMARVSDAVVVVDDTTRLHTEWDGSFTAPHSFAVITISKRGYLPRTIFCNELSDTIKLLNNGKCLDEVVVIGHYPKSQVSFGSSVTGATEGVSDNGTVGFDMNQLLENIVHYRKHKRLKKARKVLSEY